MLCIAATIATKSPDHALWRESPDEFGVSEKRVCRPKDIRYLFLNPSCIPYALRLLSDCVFITLFNFSPVDYIPKCCEIIGSAILVM